MKVKAADKQDFCDRCGNDLDKGATMLHLPFIKKYIVLCHICNLGLITGFHLDFTILQTLRNQGKI